MEQTSEKEDIPVQVQEVKKKEVTLSGLISQVMSKCKKEKRTMNDDEQERLGARFAYEFPGCPFKVSPWVYTNLNKKYKEDSVHFIESQVSGGLVRIKKAQPSVKQVLKQFIKTVSASGLRKDECMGEIKMSYQNGELLILECDWSKPQ